MSRKVEDFKNDSMHKMWGNESNMSKVDVYKWKKPEKKGELVWIDKSELNIDLEYQREIDSKSRVAEIAKNFDWPLFGVLLVSMTDDGYYVIDGGHRLRGANRREDIKELPCLVFSFNDSSEEARVFYLFNKQRKTVSTFDNYKAALSGKGNFYESEIAIKVESLIKKYGYRSVKGISGPFEIAAVGTLQQIVEKDEILADKTLSILSKAAAGGEIQGSEIRGLFYLMQTNRGIDFFSFPLKNLIAVGLPAVRSEIQRIKTIRGKSGDRVYAEGFLTYINKGQVKEKVYIP